MVQPMHTSCDAKRRRRLTSYSIKTHHITLDIGKATTTEVTRGSIHDVGQVATIPPTSAIAFLSSIYYIDELSHHAPHPGVQDTHGLGRVDSQTRYLASPSRTSSFSTLDCSFIPYPGPKSGIESENPLVEFEKQSKFCYQTLSCSSCGKEGANFPKCGKCDKAWCSRDCRLKAKATHECVRKKFGGTKLAWIEGGKYIELTATDTDNLRADAD